ncbi:MAG: nucleoid-associated protein [Bacteroidetes bacterium]|nr:nucleoid-associated protein [Bacteroidota bacterium]
MIFNEAVLGRLAVHYIGNKQNGGALLLSRQQQELDEEIREKLREALLQRFPNCHERYHFHHTESLEFNEVYNFARRLFQEPDEFYDLSTKIASHLFEVSLHPKIKPGELYIATFDNLILDDSTVSGIGLFKAETKTLFADLTPSMEDLDLQLKEGVELSKVDKGCLILQQDEEKGYEILIFDSNGKNEEAVYWKDKFLTVLIRHNEFLQTNGFLSMTKNYVTQHLPEEFEVSKTEQIDILNRSMDYFKTHGNFNKEEFETEVLHHEEIINSFRKYDEQYRKHNELEPLNEFEISPHAVKKQARVFKSVIKLDKNFHIYIHGDRQLIEKGYDDGLQKHYYKIYFDQEA